MPAVDGRGEPSDSHRHAVTGTRRPHEDTKNTKHIELRASAVGAFSLSPQLTPRGSTCELVGSGSQLEPV
jgi:hypothetical protein